MKTKYCGFARRVAPMLLTSALAGPIWAQAGMNRSGMSSSVDLNDSMSQEASGTAWLPASSPMYGRMFMNNGNMLMLHGAVMPRYTDVGSKRGDRRLDAPNWFMGMFSHPLDAQSQLGLRGMFSLDPITEGGYGYPLLFQTGETWHHQPLHDRQHPHDLMDELAVSYSRLIGSGRSAYAYVGYPGEPALGPPTYMHRLLAYDFADAPIGHHWQDATHITFGAATVGINFGSRLKLEASDFTGREPDENRYSFDRPRFDSYSARLSYNPDSDNALQVSHGFIRNPEGDGANVHRTTASWLYNRPLGADANFTTALVWGRNDLMGEGKTDSYLAEADYQRGRDTFFTRLENIQKSGHELVLPEESLHGRKFTLGAYTVGYVRDLTHGTGIDTGLGLAVTADTHPSVLNADYGGGTPLSFQIYLRLRPSQVSMSTGGGKMAGMDMSGGQTQPASPPSPTPQTPAPAAPPQPQPTPTAPAPSAAPAPTPPAPVTVGRVVTAISPNPPRTGRRNILTLTVTGSDGKPLAGAAVKAAVAMTSMDMGTSRPAFQDMGDGRYQGDVTFSMPGPWRVTLTVAPPGGGTPMR
ncbi:MAG: FixH family protein, partial [Armatimonadetes bacterium]|nr:FixH family protein [Armatimonadota bacterium]